MGGVPMWRDPCEERAEMGAGTPATRSPGPSMGLSVGHDPREECAGRGSRTSSTDLPSESATERVMSWGEARWLSRPLGPWVEPLMERDPPEGCAELGWGPHARIPNRTVGRAYGARSLRGCAENRLETACEHAHWGNK